MSITNNETKEENIISEETIIDCYVNTYNEGNDDIKKEIINDVINRNIPSIYRLMLLNCVLTKEHEKRLIRKLRDTKETLEGFAENFYYILQTDSRKLNFPNGYEDIKSFIDNAFRKNGIKVPKEIDQLLDERINAASADSIGTTVAWIKQHVMVDKDQSNEKIPYTK